MIRSLLVAVLAIGVMPNWLQAEDVVEYYGSDGKLTVARGKIQRETVDGISIQVGASAVNIAVPQINSVKYDDQPPSLITIRSKLDQGRFEEVATELKDVSTTAEVQGNSLLFQQVIFDVFRALAEIAIADPTKIDEAVSTAEKFDKSFPDSRHYYLLNEYWGRALLAAGRYQEAADRFAKLRQATWPGYKEKALVYQGVADLRQDKPAIALQSFDQVIAASGTDREVQLQKYYAQAYKGKALVDSGKPAEARTLLETALEEIPPEALEVKAIGHNALGDALFALNEPKKAMLDGYMWVHVMYNKYPKESARAMYQLSQVFNQLGDKQRSQLMAARLVASYPDSEWAKKLSGG